MTEPPRLACERIRDLRPGEALPASRPLPKAFDSLFSVGPGSFWQESLSAL